MEGDEKEDGMTSVVPIEKAKPGLWAMNGGRFWTPSETAGALPPGVYTVGMSQRIGAFLDLQKLVQDNLFVLPGHNADPILAEFRKFWELGPRFAQFGFVHKRGLLMTGPPGGGKTSIVQLLIDQIVNQIGGVVLLVNNVGATAVGLRLVRQIEPNRPIMVVMEDVENLAQGSSEQHLLSLLDGEHQVGGVMYVATTNYPEKLPDRLIARPSRFDLVIEIGMPPAEARDFYLQKTVPQLAPAAREAIVAASEGLSVAHLKELVILTQLYEVPVADAAQRVQKLKGNKKEAAQSKLLAVPVTPEMFAALQKAA